MGFDDDALRTVGDLAGELQVEDLRQSGWEVVGPRREDDGLTWVRASKPFSSPEQAGRAMRELSGPEGALRDMGLTQDQSFLHTRTRFSGTVDLSGGLSGFVDAELRPRLGGLPLDLDALQQRFGSSLDDLFRVEVVARLPGAIRSNAPTEVDGGVEWSLTPGQSMNLEADAKTFNLLPWLPALVALVSAAGALAVLLVRGRRSAR